jgi:hypothetical protein
MAITREKKYTENNRAVQRAFGVAFYALQVIDSANVTKTICGTRSAFLLSEVEFKYSARAIQGEFEKDHLTKVFSATETPPLVYWSFASF